MQHRLVFKKCGPDGQWVRGPRGQPWRNASQCQVEDEELQGQVGGVGGQEGQGQRQGVASGPEQPLWSQKEAAQMYSSFQAVYTVGYSLSLGALLLALAIMLGLRYAAPRLGRAAPGGGRH